MRTPGAILATTGTLFGTLVETTISYQNARHFAASNAVHDRPMPKPPPTRSAPANVNLPWSPLISADAIAALQAA
jgi:2-iminobutanoate/2-iminopropanoate deaminase